MYHEERVINRILCFRTTPKGKFIPYSLEQLTEKIQKMKDELYCLRLGDEYGY